MDGRIMMEIRKRSRMKKMIEMIAANSLEASLFACRLLAAMDSVLLVVA